MTYILEIGYEDGTVKLFGYSCLAMAWCAKTRHDLDDSVRRLSVKTYRTYRNKDLVQLKTK
jgi:hypothetical protein